jgi:hypothetical protein
MAVSAKPAFSYIVYIPNQTLYVKASQFYVYLCVTYTKALQVKRG